jgi:subtilase family serine protease
MISTLHETLSSTSSTNIEIFIGYGYVLLTFIVPLVQVSSLIYGVYTVYKQMRHQAVNVDIVLKHLALCKRNAMIFFICMRICTLWGIL